MIEDWAFYFHSDGSLDFVLYPLILTCPHTLKWIQVINILPHTKNFRSNLSHSGNKWTITETSSSNLYMNRQKDHQIYAQISTYRICWHEKKQTFQRRVSLKILLSSREDTIPMKQEQASIEKEQRKRKVLEEIRVPGLAIKLRKVRKEIFKAVM